MSIDRASSKRFVEGSRPLANRKHEHFVQSLMQGLNASAAYRAAGFKASTPESAMANSSALIRQHTVSARLSFLETLAAEESVLTKAWLVAQTRATYHAARAAGNLVAALRALELLGRERATFIPKAEFTVSAFSEMSDDDLDKYIEDGTREPRGGDSGEGDPPGSAGPRKLLH